jgi:hypothetical protein
MQHAVLSAARSNLAQQRMQASAALFAEGAVDLTARLFVLYTIYPFCAATVLSA